MEGAGIAGPSTSQGLTPGEPFAQPLSIIERVPCRRAPQSRKEAAGQKATETDGSVCPFACRGGDAVGSALWLQ